MVEIIIISILLTISAIAKAVQDKVNFHYKTSVFRNLNSSWWDNTISWKNKYTWFKGNKILTWLISNPFVFVTDAWHTFGLIRDLSIFMCVPIAFHNYWFIFGYPVYRAVFHVFYTYILHKKLTNE